MARWFAVAAAFGLLAAFAAGCENDQMKTTQQLVQQQQAQLEQQQQELEALKANQNQGYTPGVASGAGGCDKGVEMTASQRGGEHFSSGDFTKALAYYQDALSACPGDDRAEVNVARAYEAMGNKTSAIKYYRMAADHTGPTVSDASEEARNALERLQASRLP